MAAALRLDQLLVSRQMAASRSQAQQLIKAGQVQVEGQVITKAAQRVSAEAKVDVLGQLPFVGRGGHKLAAALDHFTISVAGCIALDVGASTGGFTDCLLQRGANRVYAVDVGQGQLATGLQTDLRVVSLEQTDIRHLTTLPEDIDLAVVDVSFISLRLVLPSVQSLLRDHNSGIIALVKPQFEAGPGQVNQRGILRDTHRRATVLADLLAWFETEGWQVSAPIESPLRGGQGNIEYLVHLCNTSHPKDGSNDATASLAGKL